MEKKKKKKLRKIFIISPILVSQLVVSINKKILVIVSHCVNKESEDFPYH